METGKNTEIEKTIGPILKSGGVGIIPTDTLYGVVGSALKKEAVERIYELRKRDLKKPMIILISSVGELKLFGVKTNSAQKKILKKLWPGKVSVILDCPLKKFEYLHRGGKTLAFRLPKDKKLLAILKKTGPLVAPTANLAGEKPTLTCAEAEKVFGSKVNFYVDAGKLESPPSTLVKVGGKGEMEILREGAVAVENLEITPKRIAYMFLSIIIGLMFGMVFYLYLEMVCIKKMLAFGAVMPPNCFLGSNCFLPFYVQALFLLSGLCFGIALGIWGWRVVYVERHRWKFRKTNL
jgi:L-threonylcarbamoyladenylate synthase